MGQNRLCCDLTYTEDKHSALVLGSPGSQDLLQVCLPHRQLQDPWPGREQVRDFILHVRQGDLKHEGESEEPGPEEHVWHGGNAAQLSFVRCDHLESRFLGGVFVLFERKGICRLETKIKDLNRLWTEMVEIVKTSRVDFSSIKGIFSKKVYR